MSSRSAALKNPNTDLKNLWQNIKNVIDLQQIMAISYGWVVRWPGDEDPLVSQTVGGVEAEQDVAGQLFIQHRK